MTIRSNSTANTPVVRVSAFDLDESNNNEKSENAKLTYSILSDTDQIKNTFTINNKTGEITIIRDLIPAG